MAAGISACCEPVTKLEVEHIGVLSGTNCLAVCHWFIAGSDQGPVQVALAALSMVAWLPGPLMAVFVFDRKPQYATHLAGAGGLG